MALDIKQLRQKKHDALEAAKAINNGAAATGLTAEQQQQFDAHMATANAADADIKRAESLLEMERSAPAIDAQVGHNNAQDRPWGSLAEQLLAVRQVAVSHGRITDPRLLASQGANETVDTEGGFLVQPEFSSTLIQRIYSNADVLSRCDRTPMESSRLVLNGMVDDNRATKATRFAGFQVYRIGEGAPYTPSRPKFRRIELNANKLIALFYATEELLADQSALQNRVDTLLPEAFDYQVIDEVFAGTGSGQMLGVQNSGAQVVVQKDSGQPAGTITTNNLLNMWNALWLPSRSTAVWFVQQDLEPQLDQLVLGSGVAVSLVYTPIGQNGNNGPYALLRGRPVIPVEQASPIGTQGDAMLYDLQEYIIGERSGLRADASMHVAFLTGEMCYRWMLRNDGQPKWEKPVTPRNSAQLRSPFVTLQTRS